MFFIGINVKLRIQLLPTAQMSLLDWKPSHDVLGSPRLLQALRSGTRRGHLIDPKRGALLQARASAK